jgi:undecaprenyl-diphosphatase
MFLLGAMAFGGLAYNLESNGPLLQWDTRISEDVHAAAQRNPDAFNGFMNLGFFLGKLLVQVLSGLLVLYFAVKRYWRELTMLVVGVGGGATLWYLFTHSIGRPRPPTQFGFIVTDPSFPSGHTTTAILFFGLIAYLLLPSIRSMSWRLVAIITALLIIIYIGLSRVYMGGHYPTDALAGYALGTAWAGAAYTTIETLFARRGLRHVR